MNLNISYKWLKEYIKSNKPAKEFAELLTLAGPSVDKIVKLNEDLEKVVVGKLIKKDQHPNAGRLFVGQVDVGNKIIQLVFADKAVVDVGQQLAVAVAPITLPGGLIINQTNFRGVDSAGMLCLDSELGISQEDKITFFDAKIKPGTPITEAMKLLSDEVFDIEVTSNRPDAMSVVGIAREAGAILGEKFVYQSPKPNLKIRGDVKKLSVSVKEKKICQRYQAIVMTDVKVEPSPLWLQQRLISAGLRPINNLVDITNYVLIEFGRPMHVFDYDKIKGQEINIRLAKKGEKILALDGQEYNLDSTNLVIADKKDPVAVAGIMGGELSSATENTKTIILESANFDALSVRKTARSLNLYSDSSNIYEKNLNPLGTEPAILRAIELVMELAGGKIASTIFDANSYKFKPREITLSLNNVTKTLGVAIDKKKIQEILSGLGFKVSAGDKIKVKVPWWRHNDVEGQHDLIEEIARIYGYHNLPVQLPTGVLPIEYNDLNEFYWEDKIKDILVGLGLAEVYNYSFISEKLIKNCLTDIADHIKIANPLSADFEYMRTSLIPGMIQTMAGNINQFEAVKIFELSKVYEKNEGKLAGENLKISIALFGHNEEQIFFDLKGIAEVLLQGLNVIKNCNFNPAEIDTVWTADKVIQVETENDILGHFGLIDNTILSAFGIKKPVAILNFDFNKLINRAKNEPNYKPISKYPSIELDLSMEIDKAVTYQEVTETIKAESTIIDNVIFLSEYHDGGIGQDRKSLALRMIYRDNQKTLKLTEAQVIHSQIVKELKNKYNIKVR